MQTKTEWIAVDWGASRLRAWAMQGHQVLAEACLDHGKSWDEHDGLEAVLLELIEDWLGDTPTMIVASGMVGTHQGGIELPYAAVPSVPLPRSPITMPCNDPRLRIFVVPGLQQDRPKDVMRGEETQVAGFLSCNENWDGVLCLPGSHSKWVHVSANEVVSFQTFMTGEMIELLASASVLRHSVGDGWDDVVFAEALSDSMSRPENLAARLFGIRAADLLQGQAPGLSRARLSGLLIGAELAAARAYWLGQQIAVIGADGLAAIYATAIEKQGAPVALANATEMTVAGLCVARNMLRDTT